MNKPTHIEPQPARFSRLGLGYFLGMLTVTFIQSAIQISLVGCAACLCGMLALGLFYHWMEREIPREVDTIASQVSDWPEHKRQSLNDFLRDDD